MEGHFTSEIQRNMYRAVLPMLSAESLCSFCESRVDVRGVEVLQYLRAKNEPVVFFTPHYGAFDIGCITLARAMKGWKTIGMFYDSPQNNQTTSIYKCLIESAGEHAKAIYNDTSGVRRALRLLKNGGALGIMPDVYLWTRNAVFVPFLGWFTTAMTGTAFFALKTNAHLVPAYCYPYSESRFRLDVGNPIVLSRTGDLQDDLFQTTRRIFCNMEEQISRAPEYWRYWDTFHERMQPVQAPNCHDSWLSEYEKLRIDLYPSSSPLGAVFDLINAEIGGL